jgi:hypothetical protein
MAVLPYCVLNCAFMVIVELLAIYDVKIAFSPSGHGLMTLIISYLVISKGKLTRAQFHAKLGTMHQLTLLFNPSCDQ